MDTILASANSADAVAEAPDEAVEANPARVARRPKAKGRASNNRSKASRVGSAPAALAKSEVYGPVLRWTEDDEADLRALLARRKAAGYRKPSRDVGGQVIKLGRISPNPNTVAASIVALVGMKGEITRRDLITDMADCAFPHPKAQPKDPQWCTGYISGCIRNAFLEVVPPAAG